MHQTLMGDRPMFQNGAGRNLKDIFAGAFFIAVAAIFLVGGQKLPMGTFSTFGPGRFPAMISIILGLLGAIIMTGGILRPGADIGKMRIVSMLLIGSGPLLFALIVQGAGLIPATFALSATSAIAVPGSNWRSMILIAAGTTLLAYLVFIAGLGLSIQSFGPWLRQ